jgi:hypothetical protein
VKKHSLKPSIMPPEAGSLPASEEVAGVMAAGVAVEGLSEPEDACVVVDEVASGLEAFLFEEPQAPIFIFVVVVLFFKLPITKLQFQIQLRSE